MSLVLGCLVFGYSLGAFRDRVLGKFTREDQSDSSLNLSGGHGVLLVVLAQAAGLCGDSLEGVIDKGVEDGHRSLGDSCVRVNLLENAVDVDVVGFNTFAFVLDSGGASSLSSGHFSCFVELESVITRKNLRMCGDCLGIVSEIWSHSTRETF